MIMEKLLLCVLVLNILGQLKCAVGQIVQNGQCNTDINLFDNFDIEWFQGQWYEIGRSDAVRGPDCSHYYFSVVDDDIHVRHESVNANFFEERVGTATLINGTSKLTLNFPSEEPKEFWIIDTNTPSSAIAFNCENLSETERSLNIWTLSRIETFPPAMIGLVNTTLYTNLGVTISQLRDVDRSSEACYILPVIEPGDPIVLPGSCDSDIEVVQNFDITRFSGVWHEISSYETKNSLNQCSRVEYTDTTDGILLEKSEVVNQTLITINGQARLFSDDGSARLTVELNVGTEVVSKNIYILATDYGSYAVFYTCEDLPDDRRQILSWILGRSRVLTSDAQAAVDNVIDREIVLNRQYFRSTDQSDEACFFFPEHVPFQPVIFSGLCELNIPVISDFEPERYTGIWHDIESYHSDFQTGTCRNANYRLGDGVVEVLNTQVIDETLNSIAGQAVLATTDGSGILNVTFIVDGISVTTNYWIIGTDYTSYALVYSCENINEDQRRVWAWKLSRTKYLAPTASADIDSLMSDILVLDQRYFERVDQSREGCFFVPKPSYGVPVVYPGLCDETISVVQDFDVIEFHYQWFEIQSYPKLQQPGHCINHLFAIGPGTDSLFLDSSEVYDQFLNVANGTFHFASNDSSAKLDAVINVNGETFEFPVWILGTDYRNYALAYSCVQLNDDFRAIYSWKLSRTRELSDNAILAINNIIDQVDVLDEIFYESIDQSEEACFHLPELPPGEPVILVGQCDTSITGIADFQVAEFYGEWRLIESYPSDFQTGSCNRAHYSPGANDSVVIINSQVIDETLDTIQGSAVFASLNGSGNLLVTFPDSPTPVNYIILDTDYTSYALAYSCLNLDNQRRRVWSWKMSRTNTLTESATNAINAAVNSINVLNNRFYYTIDNTDAGCFYLPDPVPGTPVVFRGQCNQTIEAMPNFNVTKYLGTWHNIQMYPSRFQEGTCSNALYSFSEDSIIVVNSQVVDQTLDTITGFAVNASADDSGQLYITFPVAGTNETVTRLALVIDTDYESYALVYACENQGSEHRQVWSWQLSRTKDLSPEAIANINSALSSDQVLKERYFWPVDQTAEGCFYFPKHQPGVPVVFPGRCNNIIPVVPNLNLTELQGVWHEIETYPLGKELGDCASHTYTPGIGNTLDLQFTTVDNLSLNIFNGSLTSAGGNTDGRLVITINLSGSVTEVPFWFLDMDSNDYALVYGCVDLPNVLPDVDHRRIFSWKLSRSRELSSNAIDAINSRIESVDVLRDFYYEKIDQSDDACFFVPEINPGQVVVFPGQCEHTNIPVVEDFRPYDFEGRWFAIESYPSDFQNGTCNDARYQFGAGDSVEITNTEVVDQSLRVVMGSGVTSPDGTGKLLVTFPGASVPREYSILATDYTDFALVYSCFNINNDERAVWSWKLSRSQYLSANAINAINEVVESVNVLNERFYEPIDHSTAGCFYFPEPEPTTTVRFRGRCEEQDITPIPIFSTSEFIDLWHIIESYPAPFQMGTCNSAHFEIEGGGFLIRNSQVFNQTLDTFTFESERSITGGMLNVTFPIDSDESIVAPLWVIATDYNSYALLYTCLQDDEYMQVWTWKLSRTRELTAQAVTAINSVTSGIQIFDDRYFHTRDQSPEACFFFPEAQPDQSVEFPGQCDNITVVENFNPILFEGLWHEIEAYPNPQQQGQCINHDYTSANNVLISSHVSDQALSFAQGSLSSVDDSARMVLTVNLNGTVVTIPFWIVDTDYINYALAYSCNNIDQYFRRVFSWKLSRNRTLSDESENVIDEAMSSIDLIDNRYFEPVDQTDPACFFLPELDAGEPVVFPGQCDLNIPVVTDFDLERYLGRWRLIESYATDFQNGDCIEATYSHAPDGSVDVFNTQVVDQLLLTINGTAVIPSNESRGILQVTFPDSTEPAYLWILDTDYASYSLVYSCQNINDEQRRVWAWKLSRDRTLSPNAITSINQVVADINVLDDQYFYRVEQSDDACFYYPEADGSSVVFRGQCDENIPVVTDFDADRYEGVWYDIESYPQNQQKGTCPTAEYIPMTNDIINIVNAEVREQLLHTVEATAVPADSPTDGRLLVTFHRSEDIQTAPMPYWILATDYNTYSLVYSCENINYEYRRVTSWKLSRTQYLANETSEAIDAIMASVPVLRQQYYVPRKHSEEDCFFYPDNNGGPVILSGQCSPENEVNAMTNFDASAFNGTWYEAARFPSNLQQGDCVTHQHEFNSLDNTFDVTKTSVYDEALTLSRITTTVSSDGRGVLTLSTSNEEANAMDKIYVLDAVYDDYALLYGCRNTDNDYMQVYSWKLTREPSGELSQAAVDAIDSIVSDEANLHHIYYEETGQDNAACFHYPDFGDDLPDEIVLPGPCDPNIRGVPDFNAELYSGRWYEIKRYPQPNQVGQCSRAQYTVTGNLVTITNEEVVNRTLLTQTGTAVPSPDGYGELTVTFDVNGVTNEANYYILATDYDDFALVYSCSNLDNGNRQVSSWQLSRTRTLSASASIEIDSVIEKTQGLRHNYYTTSDQSHDACFYIPNVDPTQGVRLRGSCEDITGQPNFNLQQYLGWWHDLRTYPTGIHTSECLSQHYRLLENGQVEFLDTRVDGLVGTITTGTVTATNDGRLTRTWPDGSQETIWVLATDYNDFSLVYSCEPVQDDDEYIRVWSSIQSKTRELSAAAQAAFAPIVAAKDYLIDEFFLPMPQTDDACFHLPNPTGQQVILPGQCDLNIPVQPNFDIVQLSGVWYQIERYPYPQVEASDTCIGSRITTSGGTANILNWAVRDGELVTNEVQATIPEDSATLEITVSGAEDDTRSADLHVLLTDYASYTLAYTCENINAFERVVVAFKLSRTRSLPTAANTAINNYMGNRQELDQRYFIQVEQHDDCEEPSSSFLVKSSVALILLCYALQLLM